MRTRQKKLTIMAALTAAAGIAASLDCTAVQANPAEAALGPQVAVLPSATGVCPPGTRAWSVYQDNEDDDNANNRFGWIGGIVSTSNTRYKLCQVDGDRFRTLLDYRVNFAVLALGPTCPSGAVTFDRRFDDEDDNNKSTSQVPAGSATVHISGGTNFRFCWFINYSPDAGPAPTSAFPNLSGAYGGFGPNNQTAVVDSGWIRADDEDDDNSNTVTPLDPTLNVYRGQWLTENHNTTMNIIRVR